jgi:hypothetical protein
MNRIQYHLYFPSAPSVKKRGLTRQRVGSIGVKDNGQVPPQAGA